MEMISELLIKLRAEHPDLIDDLRFQRIYLNHIKWTEPIALLLAELEDESQAIRIVRLAIKVDFALGARLAGAVQPRFQAQAVAMVRELPVPEWLKIELLGRTQSDLALPSLLDAIVHQDANIRSIAAAALGELGDRAGIPSLMNALTDPHTIRVDEWGTDIYDVRGVVEKALEKFAPDVVIPYLVNGLASEHVELHWQSIEILAKLHVDAAIPALIDALIHESFYVRQRAAEALGKLGAEVAIPNLIHALADEDSTVRGSVIDALGKLNADAVIPSIIKALNDRSENVRKNAACILDRFPNKLAIPALINAITDEDHDVRSNAVKTLGNLDRRVATATLLNALNHRNYGVRANAAAALGNLGDRTVIPALIDALADEHPHVLYNIAEWALKKLNLGEQEIFKLIQALTDPNYLMRRGAAYTLGILGVKSAVPALIGLLEDRNANVRWLQVVRRSRHKYR